MRRGNPLAQVVEGPNQTLEWPRIPSLRTFVRGAWWTASGRIPSVGRRFASRRIFDCTKWFRRCMWLVHRTAENWCPVAERSFLFYSRQDIHRLRPFVADRPPGAGGGRGTTGKGITRTRKNASPIRGGLGRNPAHRVGGLCRRPALSISRRRSCRKSRHRRRTSSALLASRRGRRWSPRSAWRICPCISRPPWRLWGGRSSGR